MHQSHTMHHFVTEMWTHVHISVTKWSIVGHLCHVWCFMGFVRWVHQDIAKPQAIVWTSAESFVNLTSWNQLQWNLNQILISSVNTHLETSAKWQASSHYLCQCWDIVNRTLRCRDFYLPKFHSPTKKCRPFQNFRTISVYIYVNLICLSHMCPVTKFNQRKPWGVYWNQSHTFFNNTKHLKMSLILSKGQWIK